MEREKIKLLDLVRDYQYVVLQAQLTDPLQLFKGEAAHSGVVGVGHKEQLGAGTVSYTHLGREAPVEPYILNERLLLIRETREGGGRLRLPPQGQRPEIVPALAVLLLHLEGPGVRLEDVVDVPQNWSACK